MGWLEGLSGLVSEFGEMEAERQRREAEKAKLDHIKAAIMWAVIIEVVCFIVF